MIQSEDEWCHYVWYKCQFIMLYLAWDKEINISLFFCDVFVWKWGTRPRTSSRCYHGNKIAATFNKGIFVRPPECLTACNIWRGGWKFSFPKMFDSYRDSFLTVIFCGTSVKWTGIRQEETTKFSLHSIRVRFGSKPSTSYHRRPNLTSREKAND